MIVTDNYIRLSTIKILIVMLKSFVLTEVGIILILINSMFLLTFKLLLKMYTAETSTMIHAFPKSNYISL